MDKYYYYKTRREAEDNRNKGERIYYLPGHGYYIVRPKNWRDV